MSRTTPLLQSASVTIAADGRGTVTFQPVVFGQRWRITNTSVQNAGALKPRIAMYKNAESPSTFIEGTSSGNSDSSNSVIELSTTEKLVVVTSVATPGSITTVVITGESIYG